MINELTNDTCLVIGNGPSLKDIPLDFLKRWPSFGSNKIFMLDWFIPTYYACINPLVCEQNVDAINAMDCAVKYIRWEFHDKIDRSYPLYSSPSPSFSRDPLKYIYEGFTVTYVLLQLAFWMGFERVGLVGVDHRYTFTGMPNQLAVSGGVDTNHFHPDYFGEGVRWHNPDLKRSEQAYRMARTVFDKAGRQVVNLTPGSELDVFERKDWQEW